MCLAAPHASRSPRSRSTLGKHRLADATLDWTHGGEGNPARAVRSFGATPTFPISLLGKPRLTEWTGFATVRATPRRWAKLPHMTQRIDTKKQNRDGELRRAGPRATAALPPTDSRE
jgi:hypothetical protein